MRLDPGALPLLAPPSLRLQHVTEPFDDVEVVLDLQELALARRALAAPRLGSDPRGPVADQHDRGLLVTELAADQHELRCVARAQREQVVPEQLEHGVRVAKVPSMTEGTVLSRRPSGPST